MNFLQLLRVPPPFLTAVRASPYSVMNEMTATEVTEVILPPPYTAVVLEKVRVYLILLFNRFSLHAVTSGMVSH